MEQVSTQRPKFLPSLPWGVSVALSWTWGLGLFFSVQMAIMFGWMGLLLFALPNAIGLTLFGVLTQRIADKYPSGKDFERHFFTTSHNLRYVILAYQFTAIALTLFAIFNYLFLPIGVSMPLVILLVFGAALMLGEHFDIARLKWSHLAMFGIIVLAAIGLVFAFANYLSTTGQSWTLAAGHRPVVSIAYLGYFIPILAGFLVGPWLDLQQWQRAIQIHREGASIRSSYLVGGPLFFLILMFHGTLALSVLAAGGAELITPAADGLFHAKEVVSNFLFRSGDVGGWFFRTCYIAFVFFCIVSTLDSAYVGLKWYLRHLTRKSQHIIMSLVPEDLVASPVLLFIGAVAVAAASVSLNFELEYFMAFYASFSVGYALVFLFRTTYKPEFTRFTQTTLFSVAVFSTALFGIGFFEEFWGLMILGALVPIVHGFVVISSRVVADDIQKALPKADSTDLVPTGSISGKAAEKAVTALEQAITRFDPKSGERFRSAIHKIEPAAAQAIANILHSIDPQQAARGAAQVSDQNSDIEHAKGRFIDKWFCHTFMATYSDTNSVGNVYFGNYIIWVGKVREMFFSMAMPHFDLGDTPFYILTRQIEHKFNAETKEFEIVTVRIRVGGVNRKFVTLEHEILNQAGTILGKGKQTLMFVNSRDYHLVDLPKEVHTAFLPYM